MPAHRLPPKRGCQASVETASGRQYGAVGVAGGIPSHAQAPAAVNARFATSGSSIGANMDAG